jgi:hypothetical protein
MNCEARSAERARLPKRAQPKAPNALDSGKVFILNRDEMFMVRDLTEKRYFRIYLACALTSFIAAGSILACHFHNSQAKLHDGLPVEFRRYDSNRNGVLDSNELRAYLQENSPVSLNL